MKIKSLALTVAIAFIAAPVWADCSIPQAPELLDGSSAAKDEFIASYQTGRTYISDTEAYLACLEAEEKAEVEAGESTEESQAARLELYNTTVDELQQFSEGLNTEVREFKASNPQ